MKLAALLREIEKADGPITGLELARRLRVPPAEVAAMLDALRAAGKLAPEKSPHPVGQCPASASCSLSCPGPEHCALTVHVHIGGFEVRGSGPNGPD